MPPRRMLFVYHRAFLPFEGRYLRIYNQAVALVARGWSVKVLACDRGGGLPENETIDGIEVTRIRVAGNGASQGPRAFAVMVRYMAAMRRFLATAGVDLIECCNLDGAIPTLLAARRRNLPCILDLCEPEYCLAWPRYLAPAIWGFRWMERFLARRFDAIVVHNQYQIEKFRRAGVTRVLRVGSYPRQMAHLPAPIVGSEAVGPRDVLIGRIGSIYEDNGIEELLAVYDKLKPLGAKDGVNYRLLLAGRVFDSYQTTFAEQMAGRGNEVTYTGAYTHEDLPFLYGQLTLASLIYRRTDFFRNVTPTKLFEAMACAVPVVASDIGDVAEIIAAAGCGAVVDESDPLAVAEAIHKIALDKEGCRAMGLRGRDAARQTYCFEVYETAYVDLCNQRLAASLAFAQEDSP